MKIAGIIVALAAGRLFLTVVYSAIAVWLLGLAVPVTASYIIAAVMVRRRSCSRRRAGFAAHMFIFYYAVLSEVSPPTALSPFAAAALTGAKPFETMMLTWKYTLPAFLVPFVFTLSPDGVGALLRGSASTIVVTCVTAAVGVAALAGGLGGWVRIRASVPERIGLSAGGLLLFYAAPWADGLGLAVTAVVLFLHLWRASRQRAQLSYAITVSGERGSPLRVPAAYFRRDFFAAFFAAPRPAGVFFAGTLFLAAFFAGAFFAGDLARAFAGAFFALPLAGLALLAAFFIFRAATFTTRVARLTTRLTARRTARRGAAERSATSAAADSTAARAACAVSATLAAASLAASAVPLTIRVAVPIAVPTISADRVSASVDVSRSSAIGVLARDEISPARGFPPHAPPAMT